MGTGLDPPPQEGRWGSLRLLLGLQQLGLPELGWQERCPQEGELGSQQEDCGWLAQQVCGPLPALPALGHR